jgi:hypothetical protein
MPDEYRVTIRLSPDLYGQLEARGSHGQPMAAIVRHAIRDYLTRQPAADTAAISARLTSTEQRLEAFEATAASGSQRQPPGQPPQATPQPSPQILGLYDPRAAAARIRDLRQQGLSYTLIAVQLTQEGIPTRYGKPWEHSSVRYVLETYGRHAEAP